MVAAPAKWELVRYMVDKGLIEWRALRVVEMSPSALRYQPAPDRNQDLRGCSSGIVATAQE